MGKGKLYELPGYIAKTSVCEKDIHETLDRAKKTFPKYPHESFDVEGDMIDYGNACSEWFKMWFGEPK